jgi:hypothetical protein
MRKIDRRFLAFVRRHIRWPERLTARQRRIVMEILSAMIDARDVKLCIGACMTIVRMEGENQRREFQQAKEWLHAAPMNAAEEWPTREPINPPAPSAAEPLCAAG